MNITAKEEVLFSEWKENRVGFVADGVVSEDDYLNSNIKICFVLKEVNDSNGGGWDLREYISGGARPQTFNNLARWVEGVRNGNVDIEWNKFDIADEKYRQNHLKSICAFNLKKSPGTHTTDYASMQSVAVEYKEFIKKQFELYDADLTICCGTGDLFKYVAGFDECEWHQTKRGIWWFKRADRKYVIAYCHPEARVQDPLIVYGLIDAVREIYS